MGIELPSYCISTEIYGATVYAPNGKFVRIDYEDKEGWVIERKLFDKYLATLASNEGALIKAKSNVVKIKRKDKKVYLSYIDSTGNERVVITNVVIACDGIESKIARELGLNTSLAHIDIASCIQFEMTNVEIDEKRIELYFGNNIAPGGYVWIFPKGKRHANIGIGVRKPFAKKHAIDYLLDFISKNEKLKNGSIIEVNAGGVPVGGLMKNMVEDNLIVAGDAAHQVNPIHGGGISEAWVAGRIAADVVIKAFSKNDFRKKILDSYNQLWWGERGKKLEKILGELE